MSIRTDDYDLWRAEAAGEPVSHIRAAIEAERLARIYHRNQRERRCGR